jgi:glycerol-3-phosphate acyltransferase PlsY
MDYIYSAFLGYLLGSIPSAYIFLKIFKQVDITDAGSKNVGAMNAYKVSKSKYIGITVLFADFLKGLISYKLAVIIFPSLFIYPALSVLFAVTGHCFSPWLKFKGGRGLATGAGGLIAFIPLAVASWILIWLFTNLFKRNVHIGNFFATALTGILAFTFPDFFTKYSNPKPDSYLIYTLFCILIFTIILSRHIKPIKQYLSQNDKEVKEIKKNE